MTNEELSKKIQEEISDPNVRATGEIVCTKEGAREVKKMSRELSTSHILEMIRRGLGTGPPSSYKGVSFNEARMVRETYTGTHSKSGGLGGSSEKRSGSGPV